MKLTRLSTWYRKKKSAKERKAAADAAKVNVISLEFSLEVEVRLILSFLFLPKMLMDLAQRHKLGSNLTPVTPKTFAVWKRA